MFKILIATNNSNKLKEYRNIFKDYKVEILSLKDLNIEIDPEENGSTYFENALIKAIACKPYTNLPIISDDSGIEILDLGEHYPGIYSHRYMQSNGGQIPTIKMLEEKHLGSKAIFHTSIALINLTPNPLEFIGEVNGEISKIVKLDSFGYDPIFKVTSLNKTYAEMSSEEKNKVSHRYLASLELLKYLLANKYI